MKGKLTEQISKINRISKYILKYGLLLCLIVFIITNYIMQEANYLSDILMARQVAGIGFYMVVEVVVGAVLFDVCMKNRDD